MSIYDEWRAQLIDTMSLIETDPQAEVSSYLPRRMPWQIYQFLSIELFERQLLRLQILYDQGVVIDCEATEQSSAIPFQDVVDGMFVAMAAKYAWVMEPTRENKKIFDDIMNIAPMLHCYDPDEIIDWQSFRFGGNIYEELSRSFMNTTKRDIHAALEYSM